MCSLSIASSGNMQAFDYFFTFGSISCLAISFSVSQSLFWEYYFCDWAMRPCRKRLKLKRVWNEVPVTWLDLAGEREGLQKGKVSTEAPCLILESQFHIDFLNPIVFSAPVTLCDNSSVFTVFFHCIYIVLTGIPRVPSRLVFGLWKMKTNLFVSLDDILCRHVWSQDKFRYLSPSRHRPLVYILQKWHRSITPHCPSKPK